MNDQTHSTSLTELRANVAERERPVVKAGFTDSHSFELAQRAAKAMSASDLVPTNFQGNIPNCLIALEMAQRIGASPLMVAQNLYVVHGRPSWSAKFLIASFNQCGRFSAIRYRWFGTEGKDDWGCQAFAKERESGEMIEGPLITIKLAKDEGWYQKNGSKWKTIPRLMLMYRAAAWLVNTHAPEISMGLNTAEEIRDVYDAELDEAGEYRVTTESLRTVEAELAQEPEGDEPADDLEAKLRESVEKGKPMTADDLIFAVEACTDKRECQSIGTKMQGIKDANDKKRALAAYYKKLEELDQPAQGELA